MSGRMSRTKGHSFEREMAERFREIFPKAKRHLEYQEGEAYGVDIANTGNLKIQCKRNKKYAPIAKIEEVKCEGIPVLITRGDRKKEVACLYLDDFIKIIKDIGEVYN